MRHPSDDSVPPILRQYIEKLYQKGWDAYAKAGYPFGKSDIAMLVWYEFNQSTQSN